MRRLSCTLGESVQSCPRFHFWTSGPLPRCAPGQHERNTDGRDRPHRQTIRATGRCSLSRPPTSLKKLSVPSPHLLSRCAPGEAAASRRKPGLVRAAAAVEPRGRRGSCCDRLKVRPCLLLLRCCFFRRDNECVAGSGRSSSIRSPHDHDPRPSPADSHLSILEQSPERPVWLPPADLDAGECCPAVQPAAVGCVARRPRGPWHAVCET
jgi:hypothetical protein